MLDPQHLAQNIPSKSPPSAARPASPQTALSGPGAGRRRARRRQYLTLVTTGAPWPAVLTLARAGRLG